MNMIEGFIKKESTAGILLIIVTIAALILENSGLSDLYNHFLHTHVEIRFGSLQIAKPLLLWVNDGLMAVFFFLIGLEVKKRSFGRSAFIYQASCASGYRCTGWYDNVHSCIYTHKSKRIFRYERVGYSDRYRYSFCSRYSLTA